ALVMHHLNALIAGTGVLILDTLVSDPAHGLTVWTFSGQPTSRVLVQAFNLASGPDQLIDTDEIVFGIAGEVDRRGAVVMESGRDNHYVMNMSWVLLPCPTVEVFMNANADFATFEAYLRGLEVPSVTDGS